jgi:hypothetical protein
MKSPFKVLDTKLVKETARKELIAQCNVLGHTNASFVPEEGATPISILQLYFK